MLFRNGTSSLDLAVYYSNNQIITKLLDAGAEADVTEPKKTYISTPLLKAISLGNEETTKLLISRGASVNRKERFNCVPPLLKAIACQQDEIVKLLLQHGASVTETDSRGTSALIKVITEKHSCKMVSCFMDRLKDELGGDQVSWKRCLTSIFPSIISTGCLQCTKLFLDYGVDLLRKDRHGKSPMVYACDVSLERTKCHCDKHSVDADTTENCLEPVCTKRSHGFSPVRADVFNLLLTSGADVTEAWNSVIFNMSRNSFERCNEDALVDLIRSKGTQMSQHNIRMSSFFIQTAGSAKSHLMVHLYIAGFKPSRDDCDTCLGICRQRQTQYGSTQWYENISKWLEMIRDNPKSLTHLANAVVRESLGDSILHSVDSLKLPETIKDIIRLKEMSDIRSIETVMQLYEM